MPKASEVALELNKLAASLMQEPDQELPKAHVHFHCKYVGDSAKSMFLALARILPHPLTKSIQSYDDNGLEIAYDSDSITAVASVERSKVCKLIEPAKTIPAVYDCEPLLSNEEESSLVVSR